MTWSSYKPVVYDKTSFGQKDVELRRFLSLPTHVEPIRLEVALNKGKTRDAPRTLLRDSGWNVVDPGVVCPDLDAYRSYVQTSKGEWSVAKNGYVIGGPGWFSCRSACYLAAGRPVVVQDTGFREIIPTGHGLLAFDDLAEAVAGLREVEARYEYHSDAARDLAGEYFDARVVLRDLVERAMLPENHRSRTR